MDGNKIIDITSSVILVALIKDSIIIKSFSFCAAYEAIQVARVYF